MNEETRVTVFVEDDCIACERALSDLEQFRTLHPELEIKVYDRQRDREEFEKFHVLAVPAIFVNDKLVSYGGWESSILTKHIGNKIQQHLERRPLWNQKV